MRISATYLAVLVALGLSSIAGAQMNTRPGAEPQFDAPVNTSPHPRGGASTQAAAEIEMFVFELDYIYGVGGMLVANYTPIALFKNGKACRCLDLPPEDIDLAALQRTRFEDVGGWRVSGGKFIMDFPGADAPAEIGVDTARPIPMDQRTRLQGRYRAVGGGGDTVMGGDMIMIHSKDISFRADGAFTQVDFKAKLSSASGAWSERDAAGTYELQGATLILRYHNGKVARTSLLQSRKPGALPAADDADVLWIGGEAFVLED